MLFTFTYPIMVVHSLFIYPIKSLGGIEVSSAELEPRGFALDRRWMLMDSEGRFITQRKYPQLALFEPRIGKNKLIVLSRTNGSRVEVPFEPTGIKFTVQIWDDSVEAIEVSITVSQWFSNQLGMDVRLVFMPQDTKREVDQKYALNKEDIVSFADGYPVLIVNMASLNDLNSRLKTKVPINRFRPNIVVDSLQPYQEDDWHNFKVKDAELAVVKKCSRCVMVNVDSDTGSKEVEVLAELSNYRKANNKVYFGMNAIPLKTGAISVGDMIEVL